MIFYTSNNEAALIAAEAQICLNCGFPNGNGTDRWAIVTKAVNEDLWFFEKPTGYNQFTQTQMIDGIDLTDITEQERNQDWFPIPEEEA